MICIDCGKPAEHCLVIDTRENPCWIGWFVTLIEWIDTPNYRGPYCYRCALTIYDSETRAKSRAQTEAFVIAERARFLNGDQKCGTCHTHLATMLFPATCNACQGFDGLEPKLDYAARQAIVQRGIDWQARHAKKLPLGASQ